jgi:chromosome segregation ATPase
VESELKEKFLELLDKDKEFRYAVAAYLGLADILRRLDRFEEIQTKILEEIMKMRIEQNKLWENQNRMWEEIKGLRENQEKLWKNQEKLWENQNKMWENQNKILEEIKNLRENQEKLWENQNRMWEEIKALRENQEKLWENQNKMWENQNRMWEEIKNLREGQQKLWENQNKIWEEINKTWKEIKSLREEQTKIWKEIRSINERINAIREEQRRISITVERLTISVEEEARDVISYKLSKELGIEIKLDRLFINDREINIYGAVGDICVIGEASVRVGPRIVKEIEEKIELIRKYRPELLRPKLIKVIYADVVPPKVLELASKNNIWVLNWKGDLLPMKIIQ